jgi:7-carboxy-7-deazaguanine synthase
MKETENFIFIKEIFGPTIQGEGPNIGKKCIFVRVAGCDFRCTWCDTKRALKVNSSSQKFTVVDLSKKILDLCKNSFCPHVILTGGNPCIYDFTYVIGELHKNGIKVDVEAQGSVVPDWLNLCDLVVLSPKGPSSGQRDVYNNIEKFLLSKKTRIIIKIPIFNDDDVNFLKRYQELCKKYGVDLYATVGNNDSEYKGDMSKIILEKYKIILEKLIKEKIDSIYLLPQLHVLLWGNKSGV